MRRDRVVSLTIISHSALLDWDAHLRGDITFNLFLAITLGFSLSQILNDLFFKLSITHLALPGIIECIFGPSVLKFRRHGVVRSLLFIQFFPAIILLMLEVDVWAGPLLVSSLVCILCLTLLLIGDKLLALEGRINWYVAIGHFAQVIYTLIKVEKSFVSIVNSFGVLLLIPLFDPSSLLVLTVLFLDIWDVCVRVLFYLHHVHSFQSLHWVYYSTVTLALLQTLKQ